MTTNSRAPSAMAIEQVRDRMNATDKAKRQFLMEHRHISPRGELAATRGNEWLDSQRLKHFIPDICFRAQAAYDRILAFNIPLHLEETVLKDGLIIAPESFSEAVRSAPRAIVLSAGLEAMDHLRAHGMRLGDTIHIVRNFSWALDVGNCGVYHFGLLVMRSGDVVAAEQTRERLDSGELSITFKDGEHGYVHNGEEQGRAMPTLSQHE